MAEFDNTHPSVTSEKRHAQFITEAAKLMSEHAQKATRDGLKTQTISLRRFKAPILDQAVELLQRPRRTGARSLSLVEIRKTERAFFEQLKTSIRAGNPRYRVSLEQWEADSFGGSLERVIQFDPTDSAWSR